MKLNWKKHKNNLLHLLNSFDDKERIIKSIDDLKLLQEKNERILFEITEIKEKGFEVNIEQLSGFVSFNHLPWKYPRKEYWKVISKHLLGHKFYGTIYDIEGLSILIEGGIPQFKEIELKENEEYSGIVIHKSKYGIFIDIGYHFDWVNGSFFGLFHKSNSNNFEELSLIEIGNEIIVKFQGYMDDGDLIFGDEVIQKELSSKEIDEFTGTIQNIKVVISKEGRKEFYLMGKYKCRIPITKTIYSESKFIVKDYIMNLKDGDILKCEIIDIDKYKRTLISKLVLESMDNN